MKQYVGFSGRAPRSEYWWFFLFNVLVSLVAGAVDAGLFGSGADGIAAGQGPAGILSSLVLLLPNLAVGMRRLHDTGRSGWWLLIILVPCIGFVVLLVFFCQRGQGEVNRFGEPPLLPPGPPGPYYSEQPGHW